LITIVVLPNMKGQAKIVPNDAPNVIQSLSTQPNIILKTASAFFMTTNALLCHQQHHITLQS